jgi:type I restriction enzyme S subunit
MSHDTSWPLASLGDLARERMLNGGYQKGMYYGSGTKIVRMVDLYRGKIIDVDSLDRVVYPRQISDDYLLSKGDILINRTSVKRDGVAKPSLVSYLPEPCYFDCSIIRVRPDQSKVNSLYLLYALMSPLVRNQVERLSKTATITTISQPDLRKLQIPVPPIPVQERIAVNLERMDALLMKRQQANQLADQFLQSAFLEMFGDPATNPKGWPTRKLEDCIAGKPNNGFFAKAYHYHQEGLPIIWISDFIDRFYSNVIGLKRVRLGHDDVPKYQVKYGDVLFCRSSLNYEGIGKVGIVPKTLKETTIFECHIIRLRFDVGKVLPEFFRVFSDLPFFRKQIERRAKTATMTTIGQEGITSCSVYVPPLSEQQRFAALVEKVESLRAKQRESEKELEELFQSLMQRAFRGELVLPSGGINSE